jgi:hypothetical protein
MDKNNRKKNELLGESHGAASNRLKKMIMFSLLVETQRNICFQCGEQILSVEELSVEHKEPWMAAEDPRAAFFDLNNIAFSHLVCNIAAARRVTADHGSTTAYQNGCRCDECKQAHATSWQTYAQNRKERGVPRKAYYNYQPTGKKPTGRPRDLNHGVNMYKHGCRCEICVESQRKKWRLEAQRYRKPSPSSPNQT